MNLIVTMAGKYIRFKQAGFTIPKFLLPLKSSPSIFREILKNLVSGYNFENIVFVANKEDVHHREAIETEIRATGITCFHLIFIEDTNGQSETAVYGIKELQKNSPVSKQIIIHNIDTIIYGRDFDVIEQSLNVHNGYIDVFEAQEECYSYVKTNDLNLVTEIKEKVVISNKATTGLYAFSDMDEYLKYFKRLPVNKESYISFIYDLMLQDKKRITVNDRVSRTIILGTPKEYEDHKNVV